MGAPSQVLDLIECFDRNRTAYLNPSYNETQVRREFIDPFFVALGWDVDNSAGNAPQYREVVHEDAIKVGIETRAPDYSFRIGPQRKFFVEAKKPAVNLKDDPAPAYQLRRYAWSAKLPLSIVTDFQEFAVYDCRVKPAHTDKASVARILYVPCEHYDERWEEIAGIFSREAVLKGPFDQYAESTKAKRGTAEVDTSFLKEIEGWRDALARNIALRNPSLTQRELNYAVQATIDRIIFLRICEDRGIEPYGVLQGLFNGQNTYPRLKELLYQADARYDSGLFHFSDEKGRPGVADRLTLDLTIDDKVLKDILKRLYYPESPFEFSVLPADILGQVYEQFLGKVIRLTAGHQAKVEDKPEVKKAGGVYYTPTYIVDYIVKNTVGRLLEGLTPKQAADLRILDPACGSGSFLIGAYQYLLDWYRDRYVEDGPVKHAKKKVIYEGPGGEWCLTTAERKRILLSNIYGVDIDAQAVETTKLSLLLKVLEGETSETLSSQLSFLHERALPDLSANIKCGNSLVEPDDVSPQMNLLDVEESIRINAFNWHDEFAGVMANGGFDCVIGNPPYLGIQNTLEEDRLLWSRRYRTLKRRFDVYGLFIERSLSLLDGDGLFGMIVPSTMLNNLTFSALREVLLEEAWVRSIVNLGGRVFAGVNNDTMILLFSKGAKRDGETSIYDVREYGRGLASAELTGVQNLATIAISPGFEFQLRVSHDVGSLLQTMREGSVRLGDLCRCFQGFVTGGNAAYIVDYATIERESLETQCCRPTVFGDGISRYAPPRSESFVMYLTKDSDLSQLPNIARRLEPFRAQLAKKREVQMGRQPWYVLHWPRVQANFERPEKILVQDIRNLALRRRIVATLDTNRLYADATVNILYPTQSDYSLLYILGVLNSTLVNFIFGRQHIDIHAKGVYLVELPLPAVDFGDETSTRRHDSMIGLVSRMLDRTARLVAAKTDHETTALRRETDSLDRQIDRLVYDLYGLTDDEIALVEESTPT